MAEKKYLDYEGLQELVLKIKEYVGDAGKIEFKGTVADVAHLPTLADQKVGWMYTIQAEGVTTAQFTDGAGKRVAANSEVAAVKVSGTTEVPIFSVDGGSSYVTSDLTAYVPTGTVGAGTAVCKVYIATDVDTDLEEGHWYVTEDGRAFYDATVLADTFTDITKTAVSNQDAIAVLDGKYTESAFADLNTYTETITGDVMLWCLLGPVFDVSDKLSFGDAFPSNPANGDTFLYMGPTTTEDVYNELTLEDGADIEGLGYYHRAAGTTDPWTLASETTADTTTYDYAEKETVEKYVKGVIYVYDETEGDWIAQTAGDTFTPISNQEIDALFD